MMTIFPLLMLMMQTVVNMTEPASVAEHHAEVHDGKVYDEGRDAHADVDAALTRAATSNKRVIVVMGANWCHDSKSLGRRFETPRFAEMMQPRYEIVYVDVGKPQTGSGRNLDIAKRFGAKKIKGTPTVLILSPQGKLLNKKDAGSWRNAASRSEDDVFAYFRGL